VYSTTGENLGVIQVDSAIQLEKNSQGIENENPEGESSDSEVLSSEKASVHGRHKTRQQKVRSSKVHKRKFAQAPAWCS